MPRKKKTTPDDYHTAFPTRLRFIMDEQRKTQQDVADAIGKTRQSVGYYADGSSSPDWKTIVSLANYFGVSTDWLLGQSEIKSTNLDVINVCNQTGLSESSLQYLSLFKDSPSIESLNALLCESTFWGICSRLFSLSLDVLKAKNYEKDTPYHGENISFYCDVQDGILLQGYDVCEYRYQSLTRELANLIESVSGISELRDYTNSKREKGFPEFLKSFTNMENN